MRWIRACGTRSPLHDYICWNAPLYRTHLKFIGPCMFEGKDYELPQAASCRAHSKHCSSLETTLQYIHVHVFMVTTPGSSHSYVPVFSTEQHSQFIAYHSILSMHGYVLRYFCIAVNSFFFPANI